MRATRGGKQKVFKDVGLQCKSLVQGDWEGLGASKGKIRRKKGELTSDLVRKKRN